MDDSRANGQNYASLPLSARARARNDRFNRLPMIRESIIVYSVVKVISRASQRVDRVNRSRVLSKAVAPP